MSAYAVLTLQPKPGRSGDALAGEMLRKQDAKVPLVGTLVPRERGALYERAVEDARCNCQAAGYGFELVDPVEVRVAVTIPKGRWRHRIERFLRVVELERRHVVAGA